MARCAEMCHNISMREKTPIEPEIIEPEILDENGITVASSNGPSAHGDVYGKTGFFTGLFALAFTFIMLLLGAFLTVFIIAPLLLLGRLLGFQISRFKK